MKNRHVRRFIAAATLLIVPVFAGLGEPIYYDGPGWYLWMSGNDGVREFDEAAGGPYADKKACETTRQSWIDEYKQTNSGKSDPYKYRCTYHDKDWYDGDDGY